jgi:hypothetical protein
MNAPEFEKLIKEITEIGVTKYAPHQDGPFSETSTMGKCEKLRQLLRTHFPREIEASIDELNQL